MESGEKGKSRGGVLFVIAIICVAGAMVAGCRQKEDSKANKVASDNTSQVSTPQDPAKAKEHFEKGVNYSLKKEYDKAIAEYLDSLKYNPNAAVVHSNLAFAYFDKGNPDMAIQEHKKAIELDPEHANAYYGMAL